MHLRSKKELIEKFINENMLNISDSDNIENVFEKFWEEEKDIAYDTLCKEENLKCDEVRKVVVNYIYEERTPLKDDVANVELHTKIYGTQNNRSKGTGENSEVC